MMTKSVALGRCEPDEALEPGDERFVDLDGARGFSARKALLAGLTAARKTRFAHLALAGHRGSGKSTELKRLVKDVEGLGFLPVYIEVTTAADPNEIGYSDLLRLVARHVESTLGGDPRMAKACDVVEDWFREVVRIDEEVLERTSHASLDIGLGGSPEAELRAKPPGAEARVKTGLGKLLAALGVIRRGSSKERQEVRENVERYPQQLVDNVNILLSVAAEILGEQHPRGYLFLYDNLDRYSPEMINDAIIRTAPVFEQLGANTIFTIPVSLLYNPVEELVQDRYSTETLPMAPVRRRNGQPDDAVIATLIDAVYGRVDRGLFEGDAPVRRLVLASGGCPRDLLRLLYRALIVSGDVVRAVDADRAVDFVRSDFERLLSLKQFDLLAAVHLDKSVDSDEAGRGMLYRRQILEYNGERWVDVHPLLQESRAFPPALERVRTQRGYPG